jgi:argininosuccinate lyase
MSVKKTSTKLWGGRFTKDVDKNVHAWTNAIPIDKNLVIEDLWGSLSHVAMLGKQGVIPAKDACAILPALLSFQDGYKDGSLTLGEYQDDVHMDNEARLIEKVGKETGGKMHTTRSRNDQVVLDSKLYTRRRLLELRGRVVKCVESFIRKAKPHLNDVMPSYTHIQHAQPVSVAFWLTHFASHHLRDLERLKRAYDVTDENPLGAGAISGTSFPIDRRLTSDLMGFQKVHHHTLDATSARDFMLETLSANAILGVAFSRLADEFIMWSSWEFRTVEMDDGFAMGSSMMPQKKNPGVAELIRGRAARVIGSNTAGLAMLKGLPSGYNRDFHEDKEILVESCDLINRTAEVVPLLVDSTQLKLPRMAEIVNANFATATELANYLVKVHKLPFRECHDIVGSLVGELSRKGSNFMSDFDYCVKHLAKHNVKAPESEIRAVLDGKSVMQTYNSYGGTGPKAVQAMLDDFDQRLKEHVAVLKADLDRTQAGFDAARAIAKAAQGKTTQEELSKIVEQYRPKQRK